MAGAGSRTRRRWIAGIIATGVVPAVVFIGINGLDGDDSAPSISSGSATAEATPTPASSPSGTAEIAQGEALATLASLPVKGRAPKTGYDRDQFGPAWADVDGNGCDTRNDILGRDLTEAVVEADACTVRSGLLAGPYSREWIRFVRGEDTSPLVQVDHVVALSDAWQKGAQQLSPVRRERFANDPLNLLAVDGGLNQQKGDGDAATWLPPNKSFRCEYVARQVAVKARYDLWVTAAERDAIARILSGCPGQRLPAGNVAPDVTPTGDRPAAAGSSSGSTAAEGASGPGSRPDGAFATCTEPREAGAAPVWRDDPGYGPHLDGDGDGIACE